MGIEYAREREVESELEKDGVRGRRRAFEGRRGRTRGMGRLGGGETGRSGKTEVSRAAKSGIRAKCQRKIARVTAQGGEGVPLGPRELVG